MAPFSCTVATPSPSYTSYDYKTTSPSLKTVASSFDPLSAKLVHAWLWIAPRRQVKSKPASYTLVSVTLSSVMFVGWVIFHGLELWCEAWITFQFTMLLLSGDVELNPGPVPFANAVAALATADATRNARFQQLKDNLATKLGVHGASILGTAPLSALGPVVESISGKTLDSHIRMITCYWVPFAKYKGCAIGVFTGALAAECAGLVLDTVLADSENTLNVEHLIHRLNNALQFFGRITGSAEDLSKSTGAVRTRANVEQAKRALAQVPGAGYLNQSEFRRILEGVGHRSPFVATVMRAYLTIGLCLFLRGGHTAKVTFEGLGVLTGGARSSFDVYALSLPPFKAGGRRTVYTMRHTDAIVCPIGNLAALVWTLIAECALLSRFHNAINKGNPSVALDTLLFALEPGYGYGSVSTDTLRDIVKEAMDVAGIQKDGVLKLLRPSGAAQASAAGVSHEQIQARGGWASSMVMLTHYLDKSPESSQAVMAAMAGMRNHCGEVPRATIPVPAELLDILGVDKVRQLIGGGSYGSSERSQSFKLMASALRAFEALGAVLLQDLCLRLTPDGKPVCPGALPPIQALSVVTKSPSWASFYNSVHSACGSHYTWKLPDAVSVPSRDISTEEATGLFKPKKAPVADQLRFMVDCAAKFKPPATVSPAIRQWVDKYLRVTRFVHRVSVALGIAIDAAADSVAVFLASGTYRPLSISMLQQILLHNIGGAGDDTGFINGTTITFAEAHASLNRMCLSPVHIEWTPTGSFKVVLNPLVGSVTTKNKRKFVKSPVCASKRRRLAFKEHTGDWKETEFEPGDIIVMVTDCDDAYALQLVSQLPIRVWIVQLTAAAVPAVRGNDSGFISLKGRWYLNKSRKATEPLTLPKKIVSCVVHPEAVLWVFAAGETFEYIDPETAAAILSSIEM